MSKIPLRERLYRHITVMGPDECWPWVGAKNSSGYGVIKFSNGRAHRTSTTAHRVAWEIENNASAPRWMVVMHTCDNPTCCNPRHLQLGTPKENSEDMLAKGRESHSRSFAPRCRKLTDDAVRDIRRMTDNGVRPWYVGAKYGISESHVWAIATRRRKGHVPDEAPEPAPFPPAIVEITAPAKPRPYGKRRRTSRTWLDA